MHQDALSKKKMRNSLAQVGGMPDYMHKTDTERDKKMKAASFSPRYGAVPSFSSFPSIAPEGLQAMHLSRHLGIKIYALLTYIHRAQAPPGRKKASNPVLGFRRFSIFSRLKGAEKNPNPKARMTRV